MEVLLILVGLKMASADLYFHESSYTVLEPNLARDHASFGFSLGYQDGQKSNLITGAPHSYLEGSVFSCPMNNVLENKTMTCDKVDIDIGKLAPYSREYAPDVKLNLGVSIAATPDYFLTCAPLRMDVAAAGNFSYGTCFVYGEEAKRYNGIFETNPTATDQIYGGIGWKTAVDKDNDLLLIGKAAFIGNIISIDAANPLDQAQSLTAYTMNDLNGFRNVGYSIVSGKFIEYMDTLSAFSAASENLTGVIFFLVTEMIGSKKILKILTSLQNDVFTITEGTVGSMFGAAMFAADLNNDDLTELLVGAPAQDDGAGGFDMGAVHIYLGGKLKDVNDAVNHRVIVGHKDGSRFGTAIAANDIDGDKYLEIIVSAPYEDGVGALYVLSGYEVNQKLIIYKNYKSISLSKLKQTQRIMKKEFREFGFSLQTIPDLNGNGCDELAVGSPDSAKIMLLRGMPSAHVTVTATLIGNQTIREQDMNFNVSVCIHVKHRKQKSYPMELLVSNEVIGNGAFIDTSVKDMTEYKVTTPGKQIDETSCENITVKLSENIPGQFRFSAKVHQPDERIRQSESFDNNLVTVSSQSSLETGLEILRKCTEEHCEPKLSMEVSWSGRANNYTLGSIDSITVSIVVLNNGSQSLGSCALIRVSGATIAQFSCVESDGTYKCYIPTLKRYKKYQIDIKFNMSQPISSIEELRINTKLYNFCSQLKANVEYDWNLPFLLSMDQLSLQGSSYNQTVTDVEIADSSVAILHDAHEYRVVNEGPVSWVGLKALVSVEKKPFIEECKISISNTFECGMMETEHRYIFNCTFSLPPRSTAKFIASNVIAKTEILDSLVDDKLSVISSFNLKMTKYGVKRLKLLSEITMKKDISLGQRRNLIIFLSILGAVVALAIVMYVLFKYGFFKREGKKKLEELKQVHVRRMSVKRWEFTIQESTNFAKDIEDVDDAPFEITDESEMIRKEN